MSARLGRVEAWRRVAAPLLASRLLWLLIAALVVMRTMPGLPLVTALRNSLTYWDAHIYLDIAAHGYAAQPCSPVSCDYHDAFLPGLPLLIRGVTVLTRDDVSAAWLVSLVAEAFALWYVVRLVAAERDRGSASFSAWLVALAPTAMFFIAPFTESPFVAAAAASLFHARRGRMLAAGVAGALACSMRVTALALVPALVLEHLLRTRWRPRPAVLYALLIPLPLALFCVYLRIRTGDALAYLDAQHTPSFDHTVAFPWQGLVTSWNTMAGTTDGEIRSIFAREVAFGLLGLVVCVAMWLLPRIPASFALYCTLAWLLTSSHSFWRSEPRYDLALFPAVLVVVDLSARARGARPVLVGASAALMCAGTAIYAQGRWLG
jgi:hypothetical protein